MDEVRSAVAALLRRPLLLLTPLLLAVGAPSLVYPFGKDHGEYAYLGSAFLDGRIVYRDLFNVKPPLTHWLHAAAQLLFGQSMLAIRLFDWLWQTATAVLLYAIALHLTRRRWAAALAALLYAAAYFATDFWHSAQTDGFINLPVALAVLLILRAQDRGWLAGWLLAGVALGAAVLLKYPIGILLPLLAVFSRLSASPARRRPFTLHLLPYLLLGLGFTLPLLAFVIRAWFSGALIPFFEIQLGYIPQYNAGFIPDEGYWTFTARMLADFWRRDVRFQAFVALWLVEWLYLAAHWRRPHLRRIALLLTLWGLGAAVHLVVQNKYYYYHFLPILAPQALIAAHLVAALAARIGDRQPQLRTAVPLLALLLPLLLIAPAGSPYHHADVGQRLSVLRQAAQGRDDQLRAYQSRDDFGAYGWGVFSSRANLETAAYLADHTSRGDTLFVWGFEPALYYLADQPSASRFIYNFPLYGRFAWDRFRQQLVDELTAAPPAYIVVARDDAQPWVTGVEIDSRTALGHFPALQAIVDQGYVPETEIAQFTLYRRRDR